MHRTTIIYLEYKILCKVKKISISKTRIVKKRLNLRIPSRYQKQCASLYSEKSTQSLKILKIKHFCI